MFEKYVFEKHAKLPLENPLEKSNDCVPLPIFDWPGWPSPVACVFSDPIELYSISQSQWHGILYVHIQQETWSNTGPISL